MLDNRIICAIYLFCLCLRLADGTIAPRNIAVVAGNGMAMECRPTTGWKVFMWQLKQPVTSKSVTIFRNHDGIYELNKTFSSRFGIDMDESGSGLLYTNETLLDDAGLYICRIEGSYEDDEYSAHLTVLESEPFCETNNTAEENITLTEGDVILMQCSVNFRGMWAPTVEWKQHTVDDNKDQHTIIYDASTVTLINARVTTTLKYVYKLSEFTYFSCRMLFQRYNGSVHATATNLPEFTYTWKSPELIGHRKQLKTTVTEEVYIAPLPVEVGPLSTTVLTPGGNNAWYIIALILLIAVLSFVALLVGLGIPRYLRLRRTRNINMIYNASASSAVPLRRLDRPSSGEYDLAPTATPNIYDWIDGADGSEDVTGQAMASQNQCDIQSTQCYSSLMVAMANVSSPYDTLDLYAKMEPLNSETDPTGSRWDDGSIQVNNEERYTTPVPRRGFSESNNSSSSDYLEMVGAKNKPTSKVPAKRFVSQNDSDEDINQDDKVKAFAKDSEDYLQPGCKALDN